MNRLVLTCLCALALTAPAQAQSPQVDPDTPAGSEYQLPVDRAREQAREPTGAAGAAGEREQPRAGGAKADRDRDPARSAEVEPRLGRSTPEVRAQAPAPDDGGSAVVAVGGAALGVLLLGGLAGLAWRRRSVRP
jgi:hypothetical protein